tara:strand:- start:2070 stop:2258 length:189 start_codon:yes stop_codon:yes gene_type:complete
MKKKFRVTETISNFNGTLYEGDLVTFLTKESDGSVRVRDATGHLWLIKSHQITKSPVQLSKE